MCGLVECRGEGPVGCPWSLGRPPFGPSKGGRGERRRGLMGQRRFPGPTK